MFNPPFCRFVGKGFSASAGCEEEHRSDLDRVQHEAEGRSEKDVQRPGQKGPKREPFVDAGIKATASYAAQAICHFSSQTRWLLGFFI